MDSILMLYETDIQIERAAELLQKSIAIFVEQFPNGRIFYAASPQFCHIVTTIATINNGCAAQVFEAAGTTFIEQLYLVAARPDFQTDVGDFLCAHDVFRADMPPELLSAGYAICMEHPECAVFPSVQLKDTVKRVDAEMIIAETPERAALKRAQTPLFLAKQTLQRMLRQGKHNARTESFIFDCLQAGIAMRTYEGAYTNAKALNR